MKKMGIIAAMQEEMIEIKKIMTDIQEKNIFELIYTTGKINCISRSRCRKSKCSKSNTNYDRQL